MFINVRETCNFLHSWSHYIPRVSIDEPASLGLDEIGQHVLVAPTGISEHSPAIVVGRRTPRVDHEVHHRSATNRPSGHQLATAVDHREAVSIATVRVPRPRLALVHAGIIRDVEDRCCEGDIRKEDLVPALLEQQDVPIGILGQTIREHGSCRAGTDHEKIERRMMPGYHVLHQLLLHRVLIRRWESREKVLYHFENGCR